MLKFSNNSQGILHNIFILYILIIPNYFNCGTFPLSLSCSPHKNETKNIKKNIEN